MHGTIILVLNMEGFFPLRFFLYVSSWSNLGPSIGETSYQIALVTLIFILWPPWCENPARALSEPPQQNYIAPLGSYFSHLPHFLADDSAIFRKLYVNGWGIMAAGCVQYQVSVKCSLVQLCILIAFAASFTTKAMHINNIHCFSSPPASIF